MTQHEIAASLKPYAELSDLLIAATEIYLNLLLKWNAKINLTSIRQPEQIVRRHFGESFFAAAQLGKASAFATAIDLGSGAGFPGIPLAMSAPQAQVMLIEADSRKAAFLNEVIRALGLKNAKMFNGRAEACASRAELVTMRAVEKFHLALPLAQGLLAPGGRLALMIGSAQVGEAEAGARGILWDEPVPVPGSNARVLLTGRMG